MGNNGKNQQNKSRRWFLSGGMLESKKEKIKMLTPDGKMVEIEKDILEAATKQKVSNKEILEWMKNPSKKDN